jgi:hypothetical protein
LIVLLVICKWRVWQAVKQFGFFLAGYLAVVALVMGYYSSYLSPKLLLMSGLSPFGLLVLSLGYLTDLIRIPGDSVNDPFFVYSHNRGDSAPGLFVQYLKVAVYLHSFLLLGALFSAVTFLHQFIHKRQEIGTTHRIAPVLVYAWLSFLLLAYGYRFLTQAFFIDYFREFLPPLVIIFAAWVSAWIPSLDEESRVERLILGGASLSAILFVAQSHYKDQFGFGQHSSLAIALFALLYFGGKWESTTRRIVFASVMGALLGLIVVGRYEPFKPYLSGAVPSVIMIAVIYALTWLLLEKSTRPSFASYGKFVASSIMFASFVVSVSYSATLLTLKYDSEWSPEVVETVATYIREHTNPQDQVMSGAVIWEFQALRKSFMRISHPLAFAHGIPEEERSTIKEAFELSPPKVIILDRYTQEIYMENLPWLGGVLQSRYQFVVEAGPEVRPAPVKIYQLKEGVPSGS